MVHKIATPQQLGSFEFFAKIVVLLLLVLLQGFDVFESLGEDRCIDRYIGV